MQEGGRRVRKRDIGEMEGRETDGRKRDRGGKIDRKERRKNGAMKEK